MDESYRKILHATARCAAVTRSRSITMKSFVPEIGMNKNTYPPTHTQAYCKTTHCTHTNADSLWVSGAGDCLSGGEMNKESISVQEVGAVGVMMWCMCVCELMKCMVNRSNVQYLYTFIINSESECKSQELGHIL